MNANVLCIIMTYNRQHLWQHAIDQAYKQTVPTDVVIWDNGPECHSDINLFNEIHVFHGINSVGLHQRFIPALLYPHEHVMFLDDDVIVGRRFVENSLDIIKQNERSLVVSMGSVIKPPVSHFNVTNRIAVVGSYVKNSIPWHLDLGSMGASVCKRKWVHSVFNNGFIPSYPAEEIAFSMMHQVFNRGNIILAPHHEEESRGIVAFKQEHYSGMTSSDDFSTRRIDIIQSLSQKLNWTPYAMNNREWQEGGDAFVTLREKLDS